MINRVERGRHVEKTEQGHVAYQTSSEYKKYILDPCTAALFFLGADVRNKMRWNNMKEKKYKKI